MSSGTLSLEVKLTAHLHLASTQGMVTLYVHLPMVNFSI
jgi:hypothetical protein